MADHIYKFNITMTCGGCSGAVDRVLKKLDGKGPRRPQLPPGRMPRFPGCDHAADPATLAGVKSHTVSLDSQTAEVVAAESLDYDTVLNTIKKTGKKVNTGEADGQTMAV
ncbi:Heavy metal-associated domain HMA [Macrophomina phaseolina MS6]|uniref:Heavy metal-associated domain HMA n=1 Tax=Macrophomina phaseolina (strain MS6) TaxID=1126212 RepID=K2SAL3_MACPH|nr:Heavy metal-associated domain HMA [Macrophomina phaseolina MS6]